MMFRSMHILYFRIISCFILILIFSLNKVFAQVSIVATNDLICKGSSTTLYALNANGSVSWEPGGQSSNSITVSPPVTTPYTLTVTSSTGVVTRVTYTVKVCEIGGCISPPNASNPLALNTGNNVGGGADPMWQVSTDNSNFTSAIVAQTIPNGYARSPWPNCSWIGQNATLAGGINSSGGLSISLFFRAQFSLTRDEASTFAMNMQFMADNRVDWVSVNGVQVPGSSSPNDENGAGYITNNAVTLNLRGSWREGNNIILVRVRSGSAFIGLIAFLSTNNSNIITRSATCPECPAVSFSGLPTTLCQTASPVTLIGSPKNGVFSGPGISGTNFNPSSAGGIGEKTITYKISTLPSGCSNSATGIVNVSSSYSFNGLPAITCETVTDQFTLEGDPIGGTFSISPSGGLKDNKFFTPSDAGKGTKTITYTIPNSSCSAATAQIYVAPKPYKVDHVLSASATTFSDNWPMDYTSVNVLENGVKSSTKINSMFDDPFKFGSKGIWRAEESYAYVNDRKQTVNSSTSKPAVDTRKDGAMDNVALFDWANGFMSGCASDWRKVNTMTKYNSSNYEVENKNILDNYSAALYAYNGDQTVALAQNAQYNEIGYEGFEEFLEGEELEPRTPNVANGNITLFTAVPSGNAYLNMYQEYEILEADGNKMTVKMPLNTSLVGATVRLFGANVSGGSPEVNSFNSKNIYLPTTIKSITLITDGKCKVEVDESISGVWRGKIQIRIANSSSNRPTISIGSGVKLLSSSSTLPAHTGNMMVGILGNIEMEQYKMSFIPGKNYFFSSWVSYGNGMAATFKSLASSTSKRGIQFSFLDKTGATIGNSPLIEPSGPVIEKWQKLEGEFLVPEGTTRVILKVSAPFASTTDYTYMDDLRIMPFDASMQTYVYDKVNLKLRAVLDNNNFATLYYYDKQGNLFLNKKETEKGIQTLQEVFFHQKE